MALFSDPMDSQVFKRSIRDDLVEFSLNSQMLKVLIELDGEKNLAAVHQSLGMNPARLKDIISKEQKKTYSLSANITSCWQWICSSKYNLFK